MSYILNSGESKARGNPHCEYLLHLHKTAKHCRLHNIQCQPMGEKSIITWPKPAGKLNQKIAISYFSPPAISYFSPPHISPTSISVSSFSEIYFMGIYQICCCTTETLLWDPERLAFTRCHFSSKSKYQILYKVGAFLKLIFPLLPYTYYIEISFVQYLF